MFASASGELNTRLFAERALESVRGFEHAALARHPFDDVAVACIGDVLAEHDHQRIARHLIVQGSVDRRDHRNRIALGRGRRAELVGRRVDVRRVHVKTCRLGCGPRRFERAIGGVGDFFGDTLPNRFERVGCRKPFRQEERGQVRDRITPRFELALFRRLVAPLVVRVRVRVGSNHLRVNQRGALAGPRVRHGFAHGAIALHEVRAIHANHFEMWKRLHQSRNITARGVVFGRARNRVSVVLDDADDRKLLGADRVHEFPELSFAGRAVADRHVGDFVWLRLRRWQRPGAAGVSTLRRCLRPAGTACPSRSSGS